MVQALDEVGRISDSELVGRLERLVKADRALSAKLLVHLGEVEARGLHRELSYSSMFEYCRSALGMSEGEAGLRILAARVCRRFPLVVERLGSADLNLTAIRLLAPILTEENCVQLLDRVRGMTKRQIEVLVAELAPKPDVPARIRKLPERRARSRSNTASPTAPCSPAPMSVAQTLAPVTPVLVMPLPAASDSSTSAQPTAAALGDAFVQQSPRPRARLKPLSPGRFSLELTVGQETLDALDQLVELFRHQNPSGDMTCIVERALCELLKREMKRRFGQTDAKQSQTDAKQSQVTREPAPAATPKAETETESKVSSTKSRYIPMKILREVHARDMGQCTFVSEDGRRCTERGFLQVHHHSTTFARGGAATAENLRLACRAHNMFYAEQDYSRAFMQGKLRDAKARRQLSLVPEK